MRRAGLAIAVGDAVPEAKAIAHYTTKALARHGAVRETVETRSQKPNRVVEVFFASDVKRDPAGVWNPAVLLGKAFRQESIANWTRKGYINHAALVHVPDLRTSETEFSAAKAVGVNRYLRPRGNILFQPRQMLHIS